MRVALCRTSAAYCMEFWIGTSISKIKELTGLSAEVMQSL